MRNGQLKPGYTVQLATERRYVIHATIHQRPTDTVTLKDHLAGFERITGRLPLRAIADAGYGSLENYHNLEDKGVEAYVKYNTFDNEDTRAYRKNIFDAKRFPYDPEHDQFACPANQPMRFVGTSSVKSATGYVSGRRI